MTTTSSPVLIILTDRDRAELESLARARKAPLRSVQRACIVLAAADGVSNAQIARDLGLHVDTVRTWRYRFATEGMKGLADRPRSGRPPVFAATVVAGVKALACSLPAEHGLPLSRWSCQDLAREAVTRGIAAAVSGSTVRRWLAADAIKPWLHRSWIFPRDPDFAAKAERVLDLYERRWQGRRLYPDEYVISADEKSQLQALRRRHEDLSPGPERTRRVEFEYTRGGTWPTSPRSTCTTPP
jgi:transposase